MRRIERRLGLARLEASNTDVYLARLETDRTELDLLVKDLLINVTRFFRDSQVFDQLGEGILSGLIRDCAAGQALRIWIAGCSTGEETYSLAILLREQIALQTSNVKLQIFASDLDSDAVAIARDGLYPLSIEADVSATRLAQFFIKQDDGYRVLSDLRALVVFTVQDVLVDPPFSRLDLISCRNLLIYLQPEAQARVISLFHFALRPGGLLLLGASETVNDIDGRFEALSKTARVYRHIGRSRPGEFGLLMGAAPPTRLGAPPGLGQPAAMADLCRRLVLEAYAPAAVLITARGDCVYSLGPTDRYLRVAPGSASHDLLSMVRHGMRTRLREALQQVAEGGERVLVRGGSLAAEPGGMVRAYDIEVRPAPLSRDGLMLVCFLDQPRAHILRPTGLPAEDASRVAELEHELELVRSDLAIAQRNLELSCDDQAAVNEEALSVNEEYQSANEELLTSKEELQSLNEELTALNSQLQESLERRRTSSNDLQNILYSTDVATLFLDADLKIRFFTPATHTLFNILPGDIGRPLSDLRLLGDDEVLLNDARATLKQHAVREREVEAKPGAWYNQRILPYRAHDEAVKGVVITFTDVTERRRTDEALDGARRQADAANIAKSRFLAAASHDLRQPLQTLALLQGLLAKKVEGVGAKKLVDLLEQTVSAMSGMLNTLLDINQIDAGVVSVELNSVLVSGLLETMRDEFTYHARAKGLTLRVVSCDLVVETDARLLEQMLRNLLTNALKYTKTGKVLLGCRRRGDFVSLCVLDTGIGIPEDELGAIFHEYHQLDNAARERTRGLGLGLSIVQRLSALLGLRVRVTSQVGRGSMFAIDLPRAGRPRGSAASDRTELEQDPPIAKRAGSIVLVEDDPELRDLLVQALTEDGHRVAAFGDGLAALDAVTMGDFEPDLILADYNLPGGMHGLRLTAKLRQFKPSKVPAIILTGDISTDTLRSIAGRDCIAMHKPIKLPALISALNDALAAQYDAAPTAAVQGRQLSPQSHDVVVYVLDDDELVRDLTASLLRQDGFEVEPFADCESFLRTYLPGREACLLLDAHLPGISGLELLIQLRKSGDMVPVVMITGGGALSLAVQAMKVGASDFIEKPISREDLIASVERALLQARDSTQAAVWRDEAKAHMARLTVRQREIMDRVLSGQPSKIIAADLGISQRTVENHRASIMQKTGAKSLPALARLALSAAAFVA